MSDGQTCRAGTECDYNNSFDFSLDQKIVKVKVILCDTSVIGQIIFYGKNGIIKKLGDDRNADGAKETFLIGDNERLIGCELETGKYDGKDYLIGVTFLKWTIAW